MIWSIRSQHTLTRKLSWGREEKLNWFESCSLRISIKTTNQWSVSLAPAHDTICVWWWYQHYRSQLENNLQSVSFSFICSSHYHGYFLVLFGLNTDCLKTWSLCLIEYFLSFSLFLLLPLRYISLLMPKTRQHLSLDLLIERCMRENISF